MIRWQKEIEELHVFFEAYFLGKVDTLERADRVLADDFTIVGPDGVTSDRAETMQALRDGHAHATALVITTTDFTLLVEGDGFVVASYIEHHKLSERSNRRLSTVVFRASDQAPNGLKWVRVHETWLS